MRAERNPHTESQDLPNPTPAEMEILRVLWTKQAATVREVHDTLSNGRDTAYTTTLKLLQIMTEKGLVTREEVGRAHLYRPRVSEAQSQQRLVSEMVERVFGGAAQKLVLQALATGRASRSELAEIRQLLDTMSDEMPGELDTTEINRTEINRTEINREETNREQHREDKKGQGGRA